MLIEFAPLAGFIWTFGEPWPLVGRTEIVDPSDSCEEGMPLR
jgi:hypothetical protein